MATIGTGKDVENGIYFSIDSQNPTHVYLIKTKDSSPTADKLQQMVREKDDSIQFEDITIEDENDVESIFQKASRLILEIISKGFSKQQIIADYTSGTKAMSAGLVLAAVEHGIEKLSYVHGMRNPETGRVETGSERLKTLSPTVVLEKKILEQAVILHNAYQFSMAEEIINKYSFSKRLSPYANIIRDLSEAHNVWDKFKFEKARELFGKIDKNHKNLCASIKIHHNLSKINSWLNRLKDESNLLPVDLFYNACRRGEEGKYDDGVARFYRLLEMIVQNEYKKIYGTDSEEGFEKTWKKVENSESEIIRTLNSRKDDIKKIQSERNHSILAHGEKPVEEKTFQKFRDIVFDILKPSEEIKFAKIDLNHFNEALITS